VKFLCVQCDEVMAFDERQIPGDGTMAAVFRCGACGREIAMLTNPMETRLVSSMGVKIGGREVPEQPMELVRTNLAGGRADAFEEPAPPPGSEPPPVAAAGSPPVDEAPSGTSAGGPVRWSPDARERLQRVPRFVRGMVKRIYTDWARERGIGELTPEVMDTARSDLGLEGM
jgi:hypothetical protein